MSPLLLNMEMVEEFERAQLGGALVWALMLKTLYLANWGKRGVGGVELQTMLKVDQTK